MSNAGLHHVTAICGSAHRNLNFYTKVLGLRLVKKTVNFDDPGTYHLYYGDEVGQPGSVLTFFSWDGVAPGRVGVGETLRTSFRVPRSSLAFWTQRLVAANVSHEAPTQRLIDDHGPDGPNERPRRRSPTMVLRALFRIRPRVASEIAPTATLAPMNK